MSKIVQTLSDSVGSSASQSVQLAQLLEMHHGHVMRSPLAFDPRNSKARLRLVQLPNLPVGVRFSNDSPGRFGSVRGHSAPVDTQGWRERGPASP